MRWFKHYSDNYRGRSIGRFYKEFGHAGISWYYLLTEICAEKLEKTASRDLTTADCTFRFDLTFVTGALRGTQAKITAWLNVGVALGLWSFTIVESELHVEYPILLELLDSDFKKTRSRREHDAALSRVEEEEDVDKDKEVDKESPKPKKSPAKQESDVAIQERREIKQAYVDAYSLRYGIEPATNNREFNSKIKVLHSKFGKDESIGIIQFYLKHNDGFYLKGSHAIGLCLLHSDSLRTQMIRNKPITSTMVKAFEKQQEKMEYNNQIQELWKEDDNADGN
jgi:hypothetical protein